MLMKIYIWELTFEVYMTLKVYAYTFVAYGIGHWGCRPGHGALVPHHTICLILGATKKRLCVYIFISTNYLGSIFSACAALREAHETLYLEAAASQKTAKGYPALANPN